ncbi:DNA repair protein RadA [candidate division KSB1 bacterium]|nr:DNA repair protein RadA [candidate division KSB1 bacterium]
MAKTSKERVHYVCQSCGYESPRWLGRCTECGEWNTMIEQKVTPTKHKSTVIHASTALPQPLNDVSFSNQERIPTQSTEFNRVLGGGLVPGSVVLIGGDPGIGKSTLLLQEGIKISSPECTVLYVSGEESPSQIKMRANRLGLDASHLYLASETNVQTILDYIEKLNPNITIIDSIQTIYSTELESAPGTVSQVRECGYQLITISKRNQMPLVLIGHVTKEGAIAGPKVLEHMVDALLFFEGDRDQVYRILRTVKNRFGSTNEIGVFEMNENGLTEVSNPSQMFLSHRNEAIPGSVVICTMEGTRPLLLEIQALVTPTSYGYPQRSSTGIDLKRLAMLLAVIEKRLGFRVGTHDVFINAVGGIRIDETAVDLGIVMAIISSIKNEVIDNKTVIIGEVGLGGEVRAVPRIEKRIHESQKLGFKTIVIPWANQKNIKVMEGIKVPTVNKISDSMELIFT